MLSNYRPGEWNLLVVPGALVALAPGTAESAVISLWERLRSEPTLAAVVDTITELAGGSFAALPPFAAVVLEGPHARIALRGDIRVRVAGADGVQTLSGSNVTTWSEHFISDAAGVGVYLHEAPGAPRLPVLAGVVRAAEVNVEITQESGDAAARLLPDVEAPALDEPEPDALPAVVAAVETPVVDEPSIEEPPVEIPVLEVPDDEPAPETEVETPAEPDAVNDQTLIPTDHTFDADFDEFQQLFGDTVHVVPPAPATVVGDHDGATISVAEARALREQLPPLPPAPVVQAAQAAPDAPTALIPTATSAGRVRVSSGQVVTLDRTVVIGRRPRATRASGADLPHLVAVDSPQQDISRSHLEIRPEGDTVLVVDLHTTNGSTLLRPGNEPVRLHPGESTLVLSGDVIDLGDGVTLLFEDLP